MQGASTLDGTVYPTTAERIATPEGGAGCTGSDCDGAAFVLSAVDAQHASGYFQGTVDRRLGRRLGRRRLQLLAPLAHLYALSSIGSTARIPVPTAHQRSALPGKLQRPVRDRSD